MASFTRAQYLQAWQVAQDSFWHAACDSAAESRAIELMLDIEDCIGQLYTPDYGDDYFRSRYSAAKDARDRANK